MSVSSEQQEIWWSAHVGVAGIRGKLLATAGPRGVILARGTQVIDTVEWPAVDDVRVEFSTAWGLSVRARVDILAGDRVVKMFVASGRPWGLFPPVDGVVAANALRECVLRGKTLVSGQ